MLKGKILKIKLNWLRTGFISGISSGLLLGVFIACLLYPNETSYSKGYSTNENILNVSDIHSYEGYLSGILKQIFKK